MSQLLRGSLDKMVATSLDTHAQVKKKYPKSGRYLEQLSRRGVTMRYGVDCTKLAALAPAQVTAPAPAGGWYVGLTAECCGHSSTGSYSTSPTAVSSACTSTAPCS